MKSILKFKIFGLIALLSLLTVSCDPDFLDVDPEYISEQQVLDLASQSPEAVLDVVDPLLSGIYASMIAFPGEPSGNFHDQFGVKAIDLAMDLMGMDMVQSPLHWFRFDYEHDNREANYRRTLFIWSTFYKMIATCNDILDFIPEGDDIMPRLISIRAQALALRGYAYFMLIQNYQHTYIGNEQLPGIPVYDQENRSAQPRTVVADVYARIVDDLETAYAAMPAGQVSKIELSRDVIAGLLARVYLVKNEWQKAAEYANLARTGRPLMTGAQWLEGFGDINNPEWMWGMEINAENSTIYASFFSHVSSAEGGYAGLGFSWKLISKNLYDKIPATDIRKQAFADGEGNANWPAFDNAVTPPYANFKFRGDGFFLGDYVYMRTAEMYLIEAEALARAGNEGGARSVLEALVTTRHPEFTAPTGNDLLEEIYLQRRIELWGEGFAFNDLRRLKRDVDRRNSNHHPGVPHLVSYAEEMHRYIYKIPQREIDTNSFINDADQNP
ncbi:MAG: RagB/SusD family nutrient uptake outer membrane protein [Bacteroidales bacterium]